MKNSILPNEIWHLEGHALLSFYHFFEQQAAGVWFCGFYAQTVVNEFQEASHGPAGTRGRHIRRRLVARRPKGRLGRKRPGLENLEEMKYIHLKVILEVVLGPLYPAEDRN